MVVGAVWEGRGQSNASSRNFHKNQPSEESKSVTCFSEYNGETQLQQFKKFPISKTEEVLPRKEIVMFILQNLQFVTKKNLAGNQAE